MNKAFETNEYNVNFYDIENIVNETGNQQLIVSEPYPVYRCVSRGGQKMFDEFYINFAEETRFIMVNATSCGNFAIRTGNVSTIRPTFKEALKLAYTLLAIYKRDPNAVFTKRIKSN